MARGEGIKHLSNLFEKYKKHLVAPQGSVKKCFCEVVSELYGFDIKEDRIEYTVYNRTLFMRFQGPLKTEVLLHKKEILNHLKGRLGEKSAPTNII